MIRCWTARRSTSWRRRSATGSGEPGGFDDLLAAAERAWTGHRLTLIDVAGVGSDRSVVLRVTVDGGPATAVVKGWTTSAGSDAPARETAALDMATARSLPAPALLASAGDPPLVVMSDLGAHGSLADALLGTAAPAADGALLAWARAVGRFHAGTACSADDFAATLERHGGAGLAVDLMPRLFREAADELPELLELIDIRAETAVIDTVAAFGDVLQTDLPALSPADTCPDNNLGRDGELLLIDFEGAMVRHIVWDAAYLTVPFPSCWCSFSLPGEAVTSALDAWRAEVRPAFPEVDGPEFAVDLEAATVGWAVVGLRWFLRRALEDDSPLHPHRSAPTRRMFLGERLRRAATTTHPVLGAVQELAGQVLDRLDSTIGAPRLPPAPAYR
ncbi:phosphotransferase [Nakamurella sp. YIM 132087]|uniref:Phosphotransferase n=1 Tax=Nakamurella alba TaxID=2665158 RepID=A0A7K1FRM7_9ACTN|nr:phosphotransferase [Nakamurella alba]MTD15893.1 phosphotransferase [Nakamurella alba]